MRYAWLVIAIFAARFFVTAIAYPGIDGDLAWQRWLGERILASGAIPRALGPETFTAAGSAWTPQEWLFSTLVALFSRGLGWDLFAGAVALCAVGALALSAWRAERRGASPVAIAVGTVLAGIALFESFGVRAQVVAWPLLVLFLIALESDGPWLWSTVPIALLWSNLHASAMLAPVVVALAAVGALLDERGFGARPRRLALVAVLTLLAICGNPFGWHLPQYAVSLFGNPIKGFISEWKVTDIDDASFAYGALPLLLGAVVFGLGSRQPSTEGRWRDRLVFGAFAWLALSAARNVPLFALVAMPLVAGAATRSLNVFATAAPPAHEDRMGRFGMPAIALVVAIGVATMLLRDSARDEDKLAGPALAALQHAPGEHRVLCADFAWCGFLVGAPHERVFLDGRADPYPLPVWNDFVTIVRLHEGWQQRLDARRVDAVVVAREAPLDQALARLSTWHRAFSDARYGLWFRNSATAATARGGRRLVERPSLALAGS